MSLYSFSSSPLLIAYFERSVPPTQAFLHSCLFNNLSVLGVYLLEMLECRRARWSAVLETK